MSRVEEEEPSRASSRMATCDRYSMWSLWDLGVASLPSHLCLQGQRTCQEVGVGEACRSLYSCCLLRPLDYSKGAFGDFTEVGTVDCGELLLYMVVIAQFAELSFEFGAIIGPYDFNISVSHCVGKKSSESMNSVTLLHQEAHSPVAIVIVTYNNVILFMTWCWNTLHVTQIHKHSVQLLGRVCTSLREDGLMNFLGH